MKGQAFIMKFLNQNWISIAIIAILLFLTLLVTCNHNKKVNEINELTLKYQKLDSVKNQLNQTVYTQEVIITGSQNYIKDLSKENFNLKDSYEKKIKEIHFYYRNKTNLVIKEVEVPYLDTVKTKRFADSVEKKCKEVIDYYRDSTVQIGTKAAVDSPHYKIDLTVEKSSIKVDSITMVDSQYIRLVELKGGFLKKDFYGKRKLFLKKSLQIQVLHTNPHFQIQGQNSVIYKKAEKKVLRTLLTVGVGILVGTQIR